MFRTLCKLGGFGPMDTPDNPADRFMLWVDAVGGFLVCLKDVVTIGQPTAAGNPDVPILGDISGRHARIRRDGECYLIEALRPVWIDGRAVRETGYLRDGSRVELGPSVRLMFRCPHPLSATARLDPASSHRTQPPADAVVLMADCCVLGPQVRSHIVCRHWNEEVILFRRENSLYCRTAGVLEIDGKTYEHCGPVKLSSRVIAGDGFSFSLEAI